MVEAGLFAVVAVAGLLSGVAAGLFGVGGGILMVPALVYLVPGTDFHVAKAASLLVIVASGGVGIWTHHRRGAVSLRRALPLAAGGFAGAAAAAVGVERVEDGLLKALFGLFLLAVGLYLFLGRGAPPRAHPMEREPLILLLLGLAAGTLSGAFGVGGGIVMVPALVFVGAGIHVAVGTSLLAVLGNALAGTATHLALGYGPLLLAVGLPLTLGAIPGMRLGSLLAHRLHAPRLQGLFGVFLALMGAAMGAESLL